MGTSYITALCYDILWHWKPRFSSVRRTVIGMERQGQGHREQVVEHFDTRTFDQALRAQLGKVARGGALAFLGLVTFKALTFLKQLTIIRMLSPSDYGLYSLGMTVVSVFMVFGGLGLYSGTQRYIAYYHAQGDEERVRGVIVSTLRLVAASAALLTLLSLVLAKPLAQLFQKAQVEQVLLLFAPLVPLSLGLQTMSSFFLGFNRTSFHACFEHIGLSLASLIAVASFLLIRKTLSSALLAQVTAHTTVFLLGLVYTLKALRFRIRGDDRVLMTRKLLIFSLPLMVASALTFLMVQTDTLMLGYYSRADQLGFYNAAFLLSNMLAIFLTAVSTIFMPVASGLVAQGNISILRSLYYSATKWLFLFSLPLFLLFFLFPSQVIGLAFGGEYPTAARALQLLCLGDFVHVFLGPNGVTLIAHGRSKIFLIVTGAATAINVALNALLIPRLGITGAAAASFTALIFVNLLTSGYLYRRYRIHPFSPSYVRYVALTLAFSVLLYRPLLMLADISRWFLLGYYPLFLGLAVLLMLASRGIDPADRMLFSAIRNRLRGNGGVTADEK